MNDGDLIVQSKKAIKEVMNGNVYRINLKFVRLFEKLLKRFEELQKKD